MAGRPAIELALTRALAWTIPAAALAVPLLALPEPGGDRLLLVATVHLSALVAVGLAVTWDLSRLLGGEWFAELGPRRRRLASGASVVALAVGVSALVTLPSSAALRLSPSLQFLQLLSALDIAWAAGATLIGFGWLWGRRAGLAAGVLVGAVCVWSIWSYLRAVGFTPDGGWQVDGAALFRYVLPYDAAALAVALTALVAGARRSPAQPAPVESG